jgi:hypothetical protein
VADLDLKAFLAATRVAQRINTPKAALKARLDQRTAAEIRADEYARDQQKRESLNRALSAADIDAMRFRWLVEHQKRIPEIIGMELDEIRRAVDSWIKAEAVKRLSEMRKERVIA